jgi:hypothetical protein
MASHGEQLNAMAERLNVNPYYLGYALETGAASCAAAFKRDGGNHLYMSWNNERWAEQAKAEGVSRDWVSIKDGAVRRHIDLIAARVAHALSSPLAA